MNTRPTFTEADLSPRGAAPFTRSRYGTPDGLPTRYNVTDHIHPTAVASIRRAFQQAKTNRDNWKNGTREGKVHMRSAMAARPTGSLAVFRSKSAQSTTRIKCYVVIDDSGSMNARDAKIPHPDTSRTAKVRVTRYLAAATFGATIVTALSAVPTVDLDVYYHAATTRFRLALKWLWHKGTPITVFNKAAVGEATNSDGNADGHALYALTGRMLREIRKGEHGIILMVSDGQPADSPDGMPEAALTDAVAHARKNGVTVIGISIDNSDQTAYYGSDMIQFDGDWTHLGGEIARLIGRATVGR